MNSALLCLRICIPSPICTPYTHAVQRYLYDLYFPLNALQANYQYNCIRSAHKHALRGNKLTDQTVKSALWTIAAFALGMCHIDRLCP